jgi:hypothetical protein
MDQAKYVASAHDPEWITIDGGRAEELVLGEYEIEFFPRDNRAYLFAAMPVHQPMIVVGNTDEERHEDCVRKAHAMLVSMLRVFEMRALELGVCLND